MLAGFFLLGLLLWSIWSWRHYFGSECQMVRRPVREGGQNRVRGRKKPAWVVAAVIRLKALMPGESCRRIAAAFNARFVQRGESVGKTFVAETLKKHSAEVVRVRHQIRNRKRKQGPRNRVWGMDITFASEGPSATPVLGILDHGTRVLLCLKTLKDRTTIGVLRFLLDEIEMCGKPRYLRTDNEAIFNSRLMRFALRLLGIRKQTSDPFCPWQNGRVERVFRTLKERLYPWWREVGIPDNIQVDLDTIRTWYNHARSHQSLSAITPAMAWSGKTGHTKPANFFEAWNGILTGWIPPPRSNLPKIRQTTR